MIRLPECRGVHRSGRRLVALTAALLLTRAAAVPAAEWVPIPSSDANVTFYLDRSTIQPVADLVYFWENVLFEKPDRKDDASGRLIKEKRVFRVVDCIHNTQGFKKGSTFSENGKLIESLTVEDSQVEMIPVAAGSVASQEMQVVCDVASRPQTRR